ncbi:Mu transposase domain-containing protein [Streptomyces sp. NPDC102405]|uniref:Mu transposase domain-containing protein n=1 Tax=Streptomyces sp. NPDC102405 TaxID=3366170 RepID=UPI00381398F0
MVRVDTCDYSIDLAAIGHQITVLTDNEEAIVLTSGGEIVAQHGRCCARRQTPSTPRPGRRCARKYAVGPPARSTPSAPPPARSSRSNSANWAPDRLFTVIDGGEGKEAALPLRFDDCGNRIPGTDAPGGLLQAPDDPQNAASLSRRDDG